jgi:hypothetical protein
MDFLKELIELNNIVILENKSIDEDDLNQKKRIYNKRNNRLFKPCKKYMVDDYRKKVKKWILRSKSKITLLS